MAFWIKLTVALVLSWLVIIAIDWFGDQFYPDYSGELDLVEIQRTWPNGDLGKQTARRKLREYMGDIEKAEVPQAAEGTLGSPQRPVSELAPSLTALLASSEPDAGRRVARQCISCHTLDKGGRNGVGPNLWNIIGSDIGSRDAFSYSPAMAETPGVWTYEKLDAYIARPAQAIPGNRMAFAGIRRPKDRANLLAYLRTLSDDPVPFPEPELGEPGAPEDTGDI